MSSLTAGSAFKKGIEAELQDRHSKSNLQQCEDCCQWDLNSRSSPVEKYLFQKKYPREYAPDSPKVSVGHEMGALYVSPVRQTFQ